MSYWLAAVVLVVVAVVPAGAEQDENARQVIDRFHTALLAVMKEADALGYQGRYERLAAAVKRSHDLPTIARISVGRYWDQLNAEQRALLVDTFSELSIATYAYQFDGYAGETFKTLSEDRLAEGQALVRASLIEPDGEQIRFDYMLRRINDHWRIVNIIVDGVSDLALKRAEYTSIIRREDFDTLIERLQQKIADFVETLS